MLNRSNLSNIEAEFKKYLLAVNGTDRTHSDALQSKTITNYLSDFRHFSGWVTITFPNKDIATEINESDIANYRSYLEKSLIPAATINRRLSSLRKFFTFCMTQGWITINPAKKIGNYTISTEKDVSISSHFNKIVNEYSRFLRENNYDSKVISQHISVLEEILVIYSN